MMLRPVDEKMFTEEEESTCRVTQHNWDYDKLLTLKHSQQKNSHERFVVEVHSVSARRKEEPSIHVFVLFPSFTLKYHELQSCNRKPPYLSTL